MNILKENILDLIYKGKYHSCVLTTFSFDFAFFELHVMRALKSAGIRNVLALVDGNILERQLEQPSGHEYAHSSTYGLAPVYGTGVFHPKIILCAGKSEGMLVVGSGNLTASGHGANDELWAAFHVNNYESPNAAIFKQAWQFLRKAGHSFRGTILERLNWVEQYAPWILELPGSSEGEWLRFPNGWEATFIGNERISTFAGILQKLKEEELESVTMLAPYYDKDGRLIERLKSAFPDATFNCILDDQYGIAPVKLAAAIAQEVSFYKWAEIKDDKEEWSARLHGKLFVFRLKNGSELCLMGSANASMAAWGSEEELPKNVEANLLLRRSRGKILESLGIELEGISPVSLDDIEIRKSDPFEMLSRESKKIRIRQAELEEEELTLYLDGVTEQPVHLALLDREFQVLKTYPIEWKKEPAKIKLSEETPEPFACVLVEEKEGLPLSNRILIQKVSIHEKCNPDPNNQKFEEIFDDVEAGNFGRVSELLQYVNFSNSDEGKMTSPKTASLKAATAGTPEQEEHSVADTYEEFTRPDESLLIRQKGLLHSPSVRIAEFLRTVRRRQFDFDQLEIRSDEQIENLDDYEGEEDQVLSPPVKRRRNNPKKEQGAVQKFLKDYKKLLGEKIAHIVESRNIGNIEMQPVSLSDLSNFLIAAQLSTNYLDKSFENETNKTYQYREYYRVLGEEQPHNGTKIFCLDYLGPFLLQLTQEFRPYDLKSVVRKQRIFKKEALLYALFCLCNAYWKDKERDWFRLLGLNTFYFLRSVKTPWGEEDTKAIHDFFTEKLRDGVYVYPKWKENLTWLLEKVIPAGNQFLHREVSGEKQIVNSTELRKGTLIFNSKLGICQVHDLTIVAPGVASLKLARPGFNWNGRQGEYLDKYPKTRKFKKNVLVD